MDWVKTALSPFGIYVYGKMPLKLWNAPTTLNKCIINIFSKLLERKMNLIEMIYISKRRIQIGQAGYSCLWNYLIPLVWVGISLFKTKVIIPIELKVE